MKHTTKTFFFKTLDLLPSKIGYFLYDKSRSFSDQSLESKIDLSEITINKLITICDDLKIDLKGKDIIEIGSGWFPIMPYFLKYKCLVKNIFTYDINQHYTKKGVLALNTIFSKKYNTPIEVAKDNKFNLPSGINYYPSVNIIKEKLPKAAVIFSRYVLSHVNYDDLIGMHKKFKEDFTKGTYLIHFISPSDLRQHNDKSISLQDFLKYSKEEWDRIQTKFDYHNRLRLPQFLEIFKDLGIEVIHTSYENDKPNSLNQKLYTDLKLHDDYKKYTEEEIKAGNILFVLKI
jgi:hypothetical protein